MAGTTSEVWVGEASGVEGGHRSWVPLAFGVPGVAPCAPLRRRTPENS